LELNTRILGLLLLQEVEVGAEEVLLVLRLDARVVRVDGLCTGELSRFSAKDERSAAHCIRCLVVDDQLLVGSHRADDALPFGSPGVTRVDLLSACRPQVQLPPGAEVRGVEALAQDADLAVRIPTEWDEDLIAIDDIRSVAEGEGA
jgi:hypothetical protein